MALPINIDELISGTVVEWERLEFKEAWNPEATIHTICAFANDFNNWGGGYIIIGIAEESGRAILPPRGLQATEADAIQKKLLEICHKLQPNYYPIVEPVQYQGKLILIVWVPGGQNRPYKAPVTLGKGSQLAYYLRRYSNTVKANQTDEVELIALTANVPFDDRINHQSTITDLKRPLIQEFLNETRSQLGTMAGKMEIEQLAQRMAIAEGPKEYLKPRNVGLMFFNDHPEKIFPKAQIEVVIFHDDVGGDKMTEKNFEGPVHYQIRTSLSFLKNQVIVEEVRKLPYQAEAERVFNYPFAALEEALVNAMYHRSYEIREPVEVRVYPDRIAILSYPGPDRSIQNKDLESGVIIARKYRNRRIGDFFKELKLTEGRSTGIPKIKRAMSSNGSPPPKFKTDEERTYFLITLPVHRLFLRKAAKENLRLPKDELLRAILTFCNTPQKRSAILEQFSLKNSFKHYQKIIAAIVQEGLLGQTHPVKPTSKFQQYYTTEKGLEFLEATNKLM